MCTELNPTMYISICVRKPLDLIRSSKCTHPPLLGKADSSQPLTIAASSIGIICPIGIVTLTRIPCICRSSLNAAFLVLQTRCTGTWRLFRRSSDLVFVIHLRNVFVRFNLLRQILVPKDGVQRLVRWPASFRVIGFSCVVFQFERGNGPFFGGAGQVGEVCACVDDRVCAAIDFIVRPSGIHGHGTGLRGEAGANPGHVDRLAGVNLGRISDAIFQAVCGEIIKYLLLR